MMMKKPIFICLIVMMLLSIYAATVSIVPRADSEGGIGTSAKRWLNGYFDYVYTSYLRLVDSSTQIYKDGSGNMCFEDGVSGALTLAELNSGGGATSEAELEGDLADVTNVFTNNDGALDDDDVTDDDIDDLQNVAIASHVAAQVLIYQAATDNWQNKSISGDLTIAEDGTATVADDSHNHVITDVDAFTEAQLETQVSDASDVYTNNDGALDDDDVTDDNVESMTTAGGAGTAPVSDGAAGLSMVDVITEAELDSEAELETQIGVSVYTSSDGTYIEASGVTYENLNTNGDVGTGAAQVAAGDHNHSGVYEPVLTDEASLYSTLSDVSDFVQGGEANSIDSDMYVDDSIDDAHINWGTGAGEVSAADVPVDASGFDGNLDGNDDTVQEVAQKLDDLETSGGGAGLWRLDLPIQSGKLGGGDITNPMAIDGGERPWEGLFDDSTDEEVVWQFIMGNDYAGGDILVTIVFSCATTQSGDKDVEFDGKFMATTPSSDSEDFNSDGYDSVQTVDHDLATDQPAGYPRVAQITFTVTQADEIAAGDICRFHLMRDVLTADDATDDVEILGVILEEQS
jgi:hypothetical protein